MTATMFSQSFILKDSSIVIDTSANRRRRLSHANVRRAHAHQQLDML